MACKDCIHYEACKDIFKLFNKPEEIEFMETEEVGSEDCQYFKYKSRFVELPCGVGDKIWTVIEDEDSHFIDEGYVASISNCKDGLWIYAVFECGLTYHYHTSRNDSYFFTYEEAEAKLKEMENEGESV